MTDAAAGKVINNANVVIDVKSLTDDFVSRKVPIAILQDMQMGAADLHYGNNILFPPGDYEVTITVNDQQTLLKFTLAN